MSEIEHLSAILGIGPDSTPDEIKQAYRDLVQVWHPDRFVSNPRLQQKAQEHLKEINRAYNLMLTSFQDCRRDSPQQTTSENPSHVSHSKDGKNASDLGLHHRVFRAIAFGVMAVIIVLVLSFKNDLAEVSYNLGAIHHQSGHYDQALGMYQMALWLNPDSPRVHSGMGEVYYALTRFEESRDAFLNAVKMNSGDVRSYMKLALCYCQLGMLDKSWEVFKQVNTIDPSCFEVFCDVGLVCERKGLIAEAERAYSKAIELNPSCEKAYRNLGLIHANKGRYDEAVSVFRKMVQLNPNNTEAKNYLSAALNKLHIENGEIGMYRNASQKMYLQGSYQ